MKRFFWDRNKVFVVVDEDVGLKNTAVYFNGEKIDKSHAIGGKLGERGKVVLGLLLLNNAEPLSSNQIQEYIEDVYNEDCNYQSVFRAVSNIRTSFWGKDLGKKFISPETIDEKEGSVIGYSIHFIEVSSFFKTDYNDEEYSIPQGLVSRDQEIDNLINLFEESKVCAICGERGLGKTELAHSFARECKRRKIFDHIIFTHYDTSIEKTIGNLETYANPLPGYENHAFDEKIYLLSEIAKDQNCLLIIDNYDNPENHSDELTARTSAYSKLINTGWKVLFTSKTDLTKIPCIGRRTLQLRKFETKDLVELFCDVADIELGNINVPLLESLIENYLRNNTYLVILTASLMEEMTLKEIYTFFESGEVNKITASIEVEKDQRLQPLDTLFNHYCGVFLKSSLLNYPYVKQLLFNIALFPLKGVGEKMLLHSAFSSENIVEADRARKLLRKNYILFERDNRITLHPLIRELILTKIPDFHENYIEQLLFSGLGVTTYTDDFPDWFRLSNSIECALANKKISEYTSACVLAMISSLKDIVHDNEAYAYAAKSLQIFSKIGEYDALLPWQLFNVARAFNSSGYALLHRKLGESESEYPKDVVIHVRENLACAEKMLLHLLKREDVPEDLREKAKLLLTKILSNVGASYLRTQEYSEAIHWHEKALNERKVLLKENTCEANALLVAASYRCVGSDWYYMADETGNLSEKLSCYNGSYTYHKMSIDVYNDWKYEKVDRYISYLRLIGSAVKLLELCDTLSIPLGKYGVGNQGKYFAILKDSAEFLTKAEIPDFKLFEECLNSSNNLVSAITLTRTLSHSEENDISDIIEKFNIYGELPEESQKLLAQLKNTIQHFIK